MSRNARLNEQQRLRWQLAPLDGEYGHRQTSSSVSRALMIEMQARTDLLQQFGMTPPLGRRESVQRGTSIRSGPTTVSPAEGAREYFVTAKSAGERDREKRRVTDGEQRRRPFETQSQRELLG